MSRAASMPWIGVGVVSSLICFSSIALAEPMREPGDRLLLAQQVVNGLPPPPPAFGQSSSTPAQSRIQPTLIPDRTGIPAAQQYVVVVNGDSRLMLDQVRSIEPGAFVQNVQGRRIIQAGIFSDARAAQQQVAALASRGIGAQVATLPGSGMASSQTAALPTPASFPAPAMAPSTPQTAPQVTAPMLPPPDLLPTTPVPREVEFGQPTAPEPFTPAPALSPSADPLPPNSASGDSRGSRSFYVIIPGGSDDLGAISNQVMRLGDGFGIAQMVQTADAPRGPHVRVGPFVDRSAANRWTRYFRDFGLDARVLYGR